MKVFLIISQILYLLLIIPWLVIFGMSFLSFDAGINLYNTSFVVAIGLYPVAIIICGIIAWIYRTRKKRLAIITNLIPMLWILSLGFLMLSF